jgi:uncharacterized phiE125 gp8 family phage protein
MASYTPVLVTPPDANDPVVTLAEAKAQLRIDHDDEDDLITSLIAAAVAHLDGYSGILGRALVTQTWRQDFDGFDQELVLPLPVAGITSVKWYDDASTPVEAIVVSTNYELQLDNRGSFLRFIDDFDYPSNLAETRALRVTFTAGYGPASAVPQNIKQWILVNVARQFDDRSSVGWIAYELLGDKRRLAL